MDNLSLPSNLYQNKLPLKEIPIKQFKKILIANRGEIALRIIRACKELGILTVAVYSQPDETSLHVKLADEAVCIGKAAAADSYLNMDRILAAAEITECDAIHPGYGFLSESEDFAQLTQDCGFTFIGPSPQNIQLMGNKAQARRTAKSIGVPMLSGTIEAVPDIQTALREAEKIGYPVMLKAAAGGGGKGIHIVRTPEDIISSFNRLTTEAHRAFGSGALYLEKYCQSPRHIEIQVIGDKFGNFLTLKERDCTIQRRHQKLLEEAPSPILDPALRHAMCESALQLCRAVAYESVGTIEYLLDLETKRFYFMEMNTRIQVEHPVTELVTNIDLIKEQIWIAAGNQLTFQESDIVLSGHAIECRINAEDPENFRPSPGLIKNIHFPGGPGVRVDSYIYNQYKVLPFYDSMIAKIIVHGANRNIAIARMHQALNECFIDGICTNVAFHKKILSNKNFIENDYDTHFLETLK